MTDEFIENRIFDDIQTGQTAELQRTLTQDDVSLFGKVSGDLNPTHMDAAYAMESGAKGVVGHSLWATSLISSLLANVLPGPGTVYRSQSSHFHRSVELGDTLTARIRVREQRDGRVVVFDCDVRNQRGEPVMHGVAEVIAPAERTCPRSRRSGRRSSPPWMPRRSAKWPTAVRSRGGWSTARWRWTTPSIPRQRGSRRSIPRSPGLQMS